jgi:predicted acylesterase/phospholipase RssA
MCLSSKEGLKAINLALQGGGSHSAFTWGVLDRLLEDERLTFDGITATGAGSINAVVLADGLASGWDTKLDDTFASRGLHPDGKLMPTTFEPRCGQKKPLTHFRCA